MGVREFLDSVKEKLSPEEGDELQDDETRDKYLRSLRRQRRIQMEEVEKEQLKKDIHEYSKARDQKYLWGVKEGIQKKENQLIKKKKEKINVMRHQNTLLTSKKLKKVKGVRNSMCFLGGGHI